MIETSLDLRYVMDLSNDLSLRDELNVMQAMIATLNAAVQTMLTQVP